VESAYRPTYARLCGGGRTPARFLAIWETDGVLSSRQIAAWVLLLWSLFMRSAGRIDNEALRIGLEMVVVLFGIGGIVKAVGKVKPGINVQAEQVDEMNLGSGNSSNQAQ
jgi:hypothetical protein